MSQPKIIGFRGKKGVGKNYIADVTSSLIVCKSSCYGIVEKGAFADPIKDFLVLVLGVDETSVYGTDAQKNVPTSYRWDKMPYDIRQIHGWKHGCMTGRELMQVFGTEMCRRWFGRNIWNNTMRRRITRSTAEWFLITDVRFPDEVEAIHEWGGQVWQIHGPQRCEAKVDNHQSEILVEVDVKIDNYVNNSGFRSDKELEAEILEFLQTVF